MDWMPSKGLAVSPRKSFAPGQASLPRQLAAALPASHAQALGLYISIPFCRSKCTYCNFSSGVYSGSSHAGYVERIIEDLRAAGTVAAGMDVEIPKRIDTVYLGGGTPSLLAPELLARLFEAVRAEFDLDADAEITMECAPGQLSAETLEAMTRCGVNRVSLGAQSFVDAEARAAGRLHTRAIVAQDLRRLRAAGIVNLNIDLIAGLPHQSLDSWEESLDALVAADAPHASVYMLEVDEDSRLGRELLQGGARYGASTVASDDAIARMYERAIERLAEAGIAQYEISNFSRPGWESRHNLRYWQRRPYLGLGLDASSMLFAANRAENPAEERFALRSTTTDNLAAYLAAPQPAETAWIALDRQHEEAWFLGLRLNAGVAVSELEQEFGRAMAEPALETARRLTAEGLLEFDGEIARLTARGRLLSNEVFQEFLAIPAA